MSVNSLLSEYSESQKHQYVDAETGFLALTQAKKRLPLMRTVHPLDFARIKLALSQQPDRDANKRGKDALQATLVSALVSDYLPHLAPTTQP